MKIGTNKLSSPQEEVNTTLNIQKGTHTLIVGNRFCSSLLSGGRYIKVALIYLSEEQTI